MSTYNDDYELASLSERDAEDYVEFLNAADEYKTELLKEFVGEEYSE